jgi:hypothetical protein
MFSIAVICVAGSVGFGGHDVEPILLCRVNGGFFEPAKERIGKLQLDNTDQKLLFLGLHSAWHETVANAHQGDRASRAEHRAAEFRILTLWHALLLSSSRSLAITDIERPQKAETRLLAAREIRPIAALSAHQDRASLRGLREPGVG